MTISGYSGSFVDFTAGLDYYFTKNVGIGGGYEYSKITYHDANTPQVGIEYKYSGPLVYVSIAF